MDHERKVRLLGVETGRTRGGALIYIPSSGEDGLSFSGVEMDKGEGRGPPAVETGQNKKKERLSLLNGPERGEREKVHPPRWRQNGEGRPWDRNGGERGKGSTPPAGAEMEMNEGRVGGPLPAGAEIGVNEEGLTFP